MAMDANYNQEHNSATNKTCKMDFGNLFYSKKELLIISESYIRVELDIKLVAAVGCVLLHLILLDCDHAQAAGCWDDSRRISRSSGSGVTSSSKGNSARGSQEELLVLAGVRAQARGNIIHKIGLKLSNLNCQNPNFLQSKLLFFLFKSSHF